MAYKSIYKPILNSAEHIMLPQICKKSNATIGEISIPPKDGIIFLNGAKNVSVITAINLKNGFSQSIFGIQVKKHLTITI